MSKKKKEIVCVAYMNYDSENKDSMFNGYDSILIYVSDEEGNKLDWKPYSDLRDLATLEEMEKKGKMTKYKITSRSMKVPAKVPKAFGAILKTRAIKPTFNKGNLYVLKN